MQGLHKLTAAANTMQAREDYRQLIALAQQARCVELIPMLREETGHRVIDAAARIGVENLLRQRPDLRELVRQIYPGFVEAI